MVQEPKRIDLSSTIQGVSGQAQARFGPGTGSIIRRLTNYHNIWGSFGVEPRTAGANANGWWVLWLNPDTGQTDPVFNFTNMNNDSLNMKIIACGTWMASNEQPFTSDAIHLNSSRNLVANQELVLSVFVNGITVDDAQVNIMLCAGLSVK